MPVQSVLSRALDPPPAHNVSLALRRLVDLGALLTAPPPPPPPPLSLTALQQHAAGPLRAVGASEDYHRPMAAAASFAHARRSQAFDLDALSDGGSGGSGGGGEDSDARLGASAVGVAAEAAAAGTARSRRDGCREVARRQSLQEDDAEKASAAARLATVAPTEVITTLGRALAQLPVEPAMGKMLLAGALFKCLDPAVSTAWGVGKRGKGNSG